MSIREAENGFVVECSGTDSKGKYRSEQYVAATESEAKEKATRLL